jgi:hypothetical protein
MVSPLDKSLKEIAGKGYPVGQDELGRTIYRGPLGDYTEAPEPVEVGPEEDKISGLDILQRGFSDVKQWLEDDPDVWEAIKGMAVGAAESTWGTISSATNPDATLGDALGAAGTAFGVGSVGTAPDDALRIFAGRSSKTANRGFEDYDEENPFNKAYEMKQRGVDDQKIWEETGWQFDEANRVWQYEIDPDDLKVNFDTPVMKSFSSSGANPKDPIGTQEATWNNFKKSVGDEVEFTSYAEFPATELIDHPKLFEAYPSLKRSMIRITGGDDARGASFEVRKGWEDGDPESDDPYAQVPLEEVSIPVINVGIDELSSRKNFLRLITHELQHGVQAIEGWDGGANTDWMASKNSKEIRQTAKKNAFLTKKYDERESYLISELGRLDELSRSDSVLPEDLDDIQNQVENIYNELDNISGKKLNLIADEEGIAYAMYSANIGEIEARAAEARLDTWDRYELPPSESKKQVLEDRHKPFVGKTMPTAALSRERRYAKGGMTRMEPTQLPPGGIASDTKDVVSANLAEGEYVIPANVVRYLGIDKIAKMVMKAEEEMMQMESGGEPAPKNAPPAVPPGGAKAFAEGGPVTAGTFNPANYQTVGQTLYNPSNPPAPVPNQETKIVNYINGQGNIMPVTFVNGQPTTAIPEGFYPQGTPAPNTNTPSVVQEDDDPNVNDGDGGKPTGAFGGRNPFELSREELTASVDDMKNGLEMLGKAGQAGRALGALNPMLGAALALGTEVAKGSAISNLNRAALVAEARGDTSLANSIREGVSAFTDGKLNIGGIPTGEKRFARDRESYLSSGQSITPYGSSSTVSSSKSSTDRQTGAPSYSSSMSSDRSSENDRSDPVSRSEPSRGTQQHSNVGGDFSSPRSDLSFGGSNTSNSSRGTTQQSNTPGDFTAPSGDLSFGSSNKEDKKGGLHFNKGGLVRRKTVKV